MRRRRPAWPVAVLVLILAAGTAVTATNVVAGSRVGFGSGRVTANDLKPAACAALELTVVRGPAPGGGNTNALIVGTDAPERINANGGDDCILGGGGNDVLRGNGGSDVCIGGPGADLLHRTCEVRIP